MEERNKEEFERIVLEYLAQTINGSASSEEIRNGLNFPILWEDLNAILEGLQARRLIKLHKQYRSQSEPKYDKVVLRNAGRESINS